jgi:hypothetical protein
MNSAAVLAIRELLVDEQLPKKEVSATPVLQRLRHRHHLLARLIAQGTKDGDVAAISGYDPSRISVLKSDPAFKELIAHYKTQVDEVFISVHERLLTLGLSSIDEMTDRIEANPESFSTQDLMELIKLSADRIGAGPTKNVTVSGTIGVMTPAMITRMKEEVEKRRNGTVERLPDTTQRLPDYSQPTLGETIDLALAQSEEDEPEPEGGQEL